MLSNVGDETVGSVHSRKRQVPHQLVQCYNSGRLTHCYFLCYLVSAVHGAHRRVHEELEPCSAAVKILQDVFGELPKNAESEDDTYNTEIEQSDMTHSTLPD